MKKFIVFLVLAIAPSLGFAQEMKYELHAGANVSGFHSGESYIFQDSKMKAGFQVGGNVMYSFNNAMVLSTGLDFLSVGGKFAVMSEYYSTTQIAKFPAINTRELALEIPLRLGYGFKLGEQVCLTPSLGIYGRYSFASIKDNVTRNIDDAGTQETEKWNCFEDYANGSYKIEAFKRFDFGANIELKCIIKNHYSIIGSYSRGFVERSSTYRMKNNDFRLSFGYIF